LRRVFPAPRTCPPSFRMDAVSNLEKHIQSLGQQGVPPFPCVGAPPPLPCALGFPFFSFPEFSKRLFGNTKPPPPVNATVFPSPLKNRTFVGRPGGGPCQQSSFPPTTHFVFHRQFSCLSFRGCPAARICPFDSNSRRPRPFSVTSS